MSGNVIGTATIKIVPDVSQFTPQLTAQLSQALNIVQAQWKQGFEDMEQAVRELIAVVKMEMAEVRQTVEMTSADIANEFNVGMERAETAVQTSGEAIETAIRETGAQAEITGERIERAFAEAGRKSDGHMSRMGGRCCCRLFGNVGFHGRYRNDRVVRQGRSIVHRTHRKCR